LVTKTGHQVTRSPGHQLENKRILITAGPTWVPIDRVRVISNIATGETGILLAEKLLQRGAKVTLLLGPTAACCLNRKIKLIRFRFFDELKEIIIKELRSKKYAAVVHSAAVSDYAAAVTFADKVKSDRKVWNLRLVPTSKIIDLIKKIDRSVFLVGFKFEPDLNAGRLISKARRLLKKSRLNLAVANTVRNKRYEAYLVDHKSQRGPFLSKENMAKNLINLFETNNLTPNT